MYSKTWQTKTLHGAFPSLNLELQHYKNPGITTPNTGSMLLWEYCHYHNCHGECIWCTSSIRFSSLWIFRQSKSIQKIQRWLPESIVSEQKPCYRWLRTCLTICTVFQIRSRIIMLYNLRNLCCWHAKIWDWMQTLVLAFYIRPSACLDTDQKTKSTIFFQSLSVWWIKLVPESLWYFSTH